MSEVTCHNCGAVLPAGFKFCGACGVKLEAAPSAKTKRDERRQVSVLFADVSGFTKMSDRLDAEEVHAVMNEVFAGLGRAIRDEGGHIDKYIGDNVMALFGAPVAHDDDPARACRAALGMQTFLRDYAARNERRLGVALRMRIGINHGLVVAGAVGSEVKMQYSVMGDTVNVASRLESSAPPGAVLVSDEVWRATRDLFEFGDEQKLTVKGKPEPIGVYVLLREKHAAMTGGGADEVELVGREAELAELVRLLSRKRLVEVAGDKGVGKTRLVREAIGRIDGAHVIAATATAATAMRPFGLVRRLIGAIVADHVGDRGGVDTAASFGAALRSMDAEALGPYVDALWYVSAPSTATVAPPDSDPLVLRRTVERGFATLLSVTGELHANAIAFVDGYELADKASAELLTALAQSERGVPVAMVMTRREETTAGATSDETDDAATPTLRLGALGDDDTAALLAALTHGAALPDALRDDLLRRAAGVPLFVTEMVRALRDAGALRVSDDGAGVYDASAGEVALPGSLRSAMVGRLDRLPGEQRELLYQCSVQGVEFDAEVASWVRRDARWAGPEVNPMLRELGGRGVLAAGATAASRWVFTQELMQEACYETLLRRDRVRLHGRVAEGLTATAGDERRVSPVLLAHHEELAERWGRAAAARRRAGDAAAALYLNDEAMRQYDRAVELADKVAHDAAEADAARRTAGLAHGGAARVHLLRGEYDHALARAECMRDYTAGPIDRAEADRVCAAALSKTGHVEAAIKLLTAVTDAAPTDTDADDAEAGDTAALAWHDLAQLHLRGGRLDEAMRCVTACRDAPCTDADANTLRADLLEGLILHTRGRFEDAAAMYQRAHDAAARAGNLSQLARAANSLGTTARDRGDYDAAKRHYEEALATWTRMGDAEGAAGAHNNLGNVAMSVGDFDAAAEHYHACLRAAKRIGNVRGVAMAHANLGLLALERSDGDTAVSEARTALATLESVGDEMLAGMIRVVMGEGLVELGDLDDADRVFADVLKRFDGGAHPLATLGATRGRGSVALMRGDGGPAAELLSVAASGYAAIHRTQEEVRARLMLARARRVTGDLDAARLEAETALRLCRTIHAPRDRDEAERLVAELDD